MSTEEPTKDRGQYKRKPYDALLHCGHPMKRDPESLTARIEKYQARLDYLKGISATRELSLHEKARFKRTFTQMGFVKLALKKVEEQGPDDRPCVKVKGQGTEHPGVGLCRYHCECKGREGGHLSYYSRKSRDKKLQDLIDEMERSGSDILDLTPDVLLLRAKMKMFIEDRPDFEPETVRSLTLISEQLRKTIDSINDKRFKASITLETFNLIQYRMAEVLMRYINDPEVLDKIASDWQKISVDTSAKKNRALVMQALSE